MNKRIPIKEVSNMIGVSLQTLRRWDKGGKLISERDESKSHRFYLEMSLEEFLTNNIKYLETASRIWATSKEATLLLSRFHCPDKSIFKARLSKLESNLINDILLSKNYKFSLITSIVGEIGNNAFDHNIGKWSDTPGIFFGYNLDNRVIIIADRGQGILNTLKRVKPELKEDSDALYVAFTEYISGRAPENRGNGLKYVRDIIQGNSEETKIKNLGLIFISGKAKLELINGNKQLQINHSDIKYKGCFVKIHY